MLRLTTKTEDYQTRSVSYTFPSLAVQLKDSLDLEESFFEGNSEERLCRLTTFKKQLAFIMEGLLRAFDQAQLDYGDSSAIFSSYEKMFQSVYPDATDVSERLNAEIRVLIIIINSKV